jgi:hypothetical protein
MVRIGLLVGGLGVLLLSVAAPLLWSWLGLT